MGIYVNTYILTNKGARMSKDTTDTIRSLLDISKTLKNFIDLQSTRIDRLEKDIDMMAKIMARYQMTPGDEAAADVDKIKQVEA
mgnify:FL=1|tara:strand:- start:224 stop:475 length:252 start_codon:yes stop_codon:yes gene_type:complete